MQSMVSFSTMTRRGDGLPNLSTTSDANGHKAFLSPPSTNRVVPKINPAVKERADAMPNPSGLCGIGRGEYGQRFASGLLLSFFHNFVAVSSSDSCTLSTRMPPEAIMFTWIKWEAGFRDNPLANAPAVGPGTLERKNGNANGRRRIKKHRPSVFEHG